MPSNFFNIRIRPYIALIFIGLVASVLIASVYINYLYTTGYRQIDELQQQSQQKIRSAEKVFDYALIQVASFKNLLLLGKDSQKYYEHLSKYYESERTTLAKLDALQNNYNNSPKVAKQLEHEQKHLADIGFSFRKALRVFNSTDIAPEVAASELLEGLEDNLFNDLEILIRVISNDTNTDVQSLKDSLDKQQNTIIVFISILLFLLLIFFYRILETKITRPVMRMVNISNQFSQSTESSAVLTDLDAIISQLDRNATQINQIMNSTGEAIYTIDLNGLCTYANPACASLLGYDRQMLIGKNLHSMIHYQDENRSPIDINHCPIINANRNGEKITSDTDVFWHKEDYAIPVEYHSYPITDDNKVIGSVVTFTDITERRNTQKELLQYQQHLEVLVEERTKELEQSRDEALSAIRTKDAFLSQMSHELRTPMNAIIGFAHILQINQEEILTPLQKENIGHIATAGNHLLGLINQLLDMTSMSAGKFNLHQTKTNICPIIENTLNMVRPLLDKKSIKIKNELTSSKSVNAYVDENALSQVLINLISNAIKFSPQNTFITFSDQHTNEKIRICVTDNGPGIDEKDQQRIFQPFERANTGNFVEGSGIGLTVCKNIMELMGGQIGVESKLGEGSTFWIDIPLHKSPENEST